jgi:hypothetical protein
LEYFLTKINEKVDSVTAVHYSHVPDLKTLHGSNYGKGIRGAESVRVDDSKDKRIKSRVYFYPKVEGSYPQPEQGLGNHIHVAQLSNMLDASKASPEVAKVATGAQKYIEKGEHASNAFESSVLDHGYHGYMTDSMHVVLNRDVPVSYVGTTVGKTLKSPEQKTPTSRHSVFDVAPNKSGEHESSLLNATQHAFWNEHKESLQQSSPSVKLKYGRLSVHTSDIESLKNSLKAHPNHPF